MARTRVRWGRMVVLGTAGLVGAAAAGGVAHAGSDQTGTGEAPRHPRAVTRSVDARIYVVKPGDTLWSIAVRVAGPTADPRPVVEAIAAANATEGALIPGQTLRLPSP